MSKFAKSSKSRGRQNRASFWRGHIERCESLGVSIAEYCRRRKLSAGSYHWWKSELKRRGGHLAVACGGTSSTPSATSSGLSFAEVTVVAPGAPPSEEVPAIEVGLPGGRRVGVRPGFDAATLAQVLRVLQGLRC